LGGGDKYRVLVVAHAEEEVGAVATASLLAQHAHVALALVDQERASPPVHLGYGFLQHRLRPSDEELRDLVHMAEVVVALGGTVDMPLIQEVGGPLVTVGTAHESAPVGALVLSASETERLVEFCSRPAVPTA
jgi:hypothetical protein